MPRQSKGARLELRPERRDRDGKLTHHATWRIRDGDRDIGTGCAQSDLAGAEQQLVDYLAAKHQPKRKIQDIESIEIADVLLIYLTDRRDSQKNKLQFDRRIKRLNGWWGGKKLSEVTGETCRAYQRQRGNAGGARRDLEDLRAAINYHASEGLHRGIVKVALPPKGSPRDRWLTRDEAARLLWVCWRCRELQKRGRQAAKGPALPIANQVAESDRAVAGHEGLKLSHSYSIIADADENASAAFFGALVCFPCASQLRFLGSKSGWILV